MVIRPQALLFLAVFLTACRQDMQDQPRYKPLQRSAFFPDGRSARPLIAGTIARGHLTTNAALYAGKRNGEYIADAPLPVNAELLARGHDRYDIYCSPCHSRAGDGRGMAALRGVKYPPSFHSERLRTVPDGYLYEVITNGYGAMPDYSYQLDVHDRWAVTEYVRVLQFSQNANISELDEADRQALSKIANAGANR